jgi:hypothetical protein
MVPTGGVAPFDVGSGKFGTPCERMQVANLSPAVAPLEAALFGLAEDPHAATNMAQPTATIGRI